MSMSKKDFIALADEIRNEGFTEHQLNVLATFCHRQNFAFKRERWLEYIAGTCGPNGGAIKAEKAFDRSAFKPFTPQ